MNTPWGRSNSQQMIIKGITQYTTPRHGGLGLSAERIAQLPAAVKENDNFLHDLKWWEEDCDWAIIAVVFSCEFVASGKYTTQDIETAKVTCQNWHRDFWYRWMESQPVTNDSELILANRDF